MTVAQARFIVTEVQQRLPSGSILKVELTGLVECSIVGCKRKKEMKEDPTFLPWTMGSTVLSPVGMGRPRWGPSHVSFAHVNGEMSIIQPGEVLRRLFDV